MIDTAELRIVIVDDEPLAVRRLGRALAAIEGAVVIGETSRPSEAPDLINSLDPDLLFIDVAMPHLDGFDVLERVNARSNRAIVFVTAHDHFAIRAFDIDALDYLLKPVAQPRLLETVMRARRYVGFGRSDPSMAGAAESLWASRGREQGRLWIDSIEWIEAQGNYAWIHAGDDGGLVRETLNLLGQRLAPYGFIRIHRSAICRASAVVAFSRQASGALQARLKSGAVVPVGRTYAAALRDLLAPQ